MCSYCQNNGKKVYNCTPQEGTNADSLHVFFKSLQNIPSTNCTSAIAFPPGTVIWIVIPDALTLLFATNIINYESQPF